MTRCTYDLAQPAGLDPDVFMFRHRLAAGHAGGHRSPKAAFSRFRQPIRAMRVMGMKLALEYQQDGRRQQHGGQQDRESWFHVTIFIFCAVDALWQDAYPDGYDCGLNNRTFEVNASIRLLMSVLHRIEARHRGHDSAIDGIMLP